MLHLLQIGSFKVPATLTPRAAVNVGTEVHDKSRA